MKVVVLEDDKLVVLQGETRPSPKPGEVLVCVEACATTIPTVKTLQLFQSKGYGRFHIGHEFSGVVTEIGDGVTDFSPGQQVAGVIPLDSDFGGFSEFVTIPSYWIVNKPNVVAHKTCAATLRCGLQAYTALFYNCRITSGDIVLITRANFDGRSTIVQLARSWGARILVPAFSTEERNSLLEIVDESCILDLSDRVNSFASTCLEATGGTGVDCIVDAGEIGISSTAPSKHDLITCLGTGGKWVTMLPNLQLDPPDAQQLHWKCASICFSNQYVWALSGSQQGRLLHMLTDIINMVEMGKITPNVHTVSIDSLTIEDTESVEGGVRVMVNPPNSINTPQF